MKVKKTLNTQRYEERKIKKESGKEAMQVMVKRELSTFAK